MNLIDSDKIKEKKKQEQSAIIKMTDRVFVSSDPLADDIKEHNKPISIIYSGHDFEPYQNKKTELSTCISVCFMGFIHDKLELSWIEMLAERSEIQITLIGPIESKKIQNTLSKYENVLFLPPMIGKDLQENMSRCDVFIMPYTIEPVNSKSTIPAKLFQYLACGKPVVSSALSNIVTLPEGFIYYAHDADDFVKQVFNAKNKDTSDLKKQRVEYAMQNRWEKRASQMSLIIESDIRNSAVEWSL